MTANEIIIKKRDRIPLGRDEIEFFISEYVAGSIPEYQASALLMAIYLNGMTDDETAYLTNAMAYSGDTLSLDCLGSFTVDKHSTGGVGDKTTLIVAPILASLGCKVAKMSGRGLGFTGGTVDKLMSVPGFNITPNTDDFLSLVGKIGVGVMSQSDKITPADKKIYALRDVTGTVESIPLIASSIMSKKIAAGARSIVLDVKVGSGAFMKDLHSAELLANTMVNIGKKCGRNMAALITDMNCPLGNSIGNSIEVIEAVELLKGKDIPDLYDECVAISSAMLSLAKNISVKESESYVKESLSSGKAYEKFLKWISSQGGNISYIENTDKFPRAAYKTEVVSEKSGYIYSMDTAKIGGIACILGAGREKLDDIIDYLAGITLDFKTGDYVNKGQRLCTLMTGKKDILESAAESYLSALTFSDKQPFKNPVVCKRIF